MQREELYPVLSVALVPLRLIYQGHYQEAASFMSKINASLLLRALNQVCIKLTNPDPKEIRKLDDAALIHELTYSAKSADDSRYPAMLAFAVLAEFGLFTTEGAAPQWFDLLHFAADSYVTLIRELRDDPYLGPIVIAIQFCLFEILRQHPNHITAERVTLSQLDHLNEQMDQAWVYAVYATRAFENDRAALFSLQFATRLMNPYALSQMGMYALKTQREDEEIYVNFHQSAKKYEIAKQHLITPTQAKMSDWQSYYCALYYQETNDPQRSFSHSQSILAVDVKKKSDFKLIAWMWQVVEKLATELQYEPARKWIVEQAKNGLSIAEDINQRHQFFPVKTSDKVEEAKPSGKGKKKKGPAKKETTADDKVLLFFRAATGDATAQYKLAFFLLENKNFKEAYALFYQAANQNHVEATTRLLQTVKTPDEQSWSLRWQARFFIKTDPARALQLYKKLIKETVVEPQVWLDFAELCQLDLVSALQHLQDMAKAGQHSSVARQLMLELKLPEEAYAFFSELPQTKSASFKGKSVKEESKALAIPRQIFVETRDRAVFLKQITHFLIENATQVQGGELCADLKVVEYITQLDRDLLATEKRFYQEVVEVLSEKVRQYQELNQYELAIKLQHNLIAWVSLIGLAVHVDLSSYYSQFINCINYLCLSLELLSEVIFSSGILNLEYTLPRFNLFYSILVMRSNELHPAYREASSAIPQKTLNDCIVRITEAFDLVASVNYFSARIYQRAEEVAYVDAQYEYARQCFEFGQGWCQSYGMAPQHTWPQYCTWVEALHEVWMPSELFVKVQTCISVLDIRNKSAIQELIVMSKAFLEQPEEMNPYEARFLFEHTLIKLEEGVEQELENAHERLHLLLMWEEDFLQISDYSDALEAEEYGRNLLARYTELSKRFQAIVDLSNDKEFEKKSDITTLTTPSSDLSVTDSSQSEISPVAGTSESHSARLFRPTPVMVVRSRARELFEKAQQSFNRPNSKRRTCTLSPEPSQTDSWDYAYWQSNQSLTEAIQDIKQQSDPDPTFLAECLRLYITNTVERLVASKTLTTAENVLSQWYVGWEQQQSQTEKKSPSKQRKIKVPLETVMQEVCYAATLLDSAGNHLAEIHPQLLEGELEEKAVTMLNDFIQRYLKMVEQCVAVCQSYISRGEILSEYLTTHPRKHPLEDSARVARLLLNKRVREVLLQLTVHKDKAQDSLPTVTASIVAP